MGSECDLIHSAAWGKVESLFSHNDKVSRAERSGADRRRLTGNRITQSAGRSYNPLDRSVTDSGFEVGDWRSCMFTFCFFKAVKPVGWGTRLKLRRWRDHCGFISTVVWAGLERWYSNLNTSLSDMFCGSILTSVDDRLIKTTAARYVSCLNGTGLTVH